MIVVWFFQLIFNAVSLWWFVIPSLPDEVYNYLDIGLDYMSAGAGILANYVPLDYIFTLFGVILVVDIAISIYHMTMWVLKKIPFVSLK